MPIFCCFVPSPVSCMIVGTIVTCLAIHQLILDYDKTTKIAEDEKPVRYVLIAIHITQVITGVGVLVASMRLMPKFLRGCSLIVASAGFVYFIELIFVEQRTKATAYVFASLMLVIYIHMAFVLLAAASLMLDENQDVIWIARRYPGGPPQPESGETAEGQAGGGRPRRSAQWYVFVSPQRFPPSAYQPQPPSRATAGGAVPSAAPAPTTSHPDTRPSAAPAK